MCTGAGPVPTSAGGPPKKLPARKKMAPAREPACGRLAPGLSADSRFCLRNVRDEEKSEPLLKPM